MITINGVLTIRKVSGRHGDFRVGRLLTDIGEFSVKDAVLDQYDEGRYEGSFIIERIYPSHYSAGGRLIVEVRAELFSIALSDIGSLESAEVSLEQDPLEEEATSPRRAPKTRPPKLVPDEPALTPVVPEYQESNESAGLETGLESSTQSPDERLFGVLWPLQASIKLDPTVDRNVFRQQRDRLKELGYCFKPIGQIWVKT